MRRALTGSVAVLLVAAVASLVVMGATAVAGPAKKSASIQACGLMPDTKTSVRWEQFDKPYLDKAFKKAGVRARVVNAQGDPQKQKSQADQCIADGAKVLIIAPIDSGSAAAIEKAAQKKGVKSIDYECQVIGGTAAIYISFDSHEVGVLQGKGVVDGLKAKGKYGHHPVVAELNGSQTDSSSYLFKAGYDSILNPLYANGTFKKGPDLFVPGWDNQKAGTIFEQMLVKTGNKIDAVVAANDGLANAVIVALKQQKLKAIPLSGQDATYQGVQNMISGWQTMTVFKDVRVLATKTGEAAVKIVKGQKPPTNGTVKSGSRTLPAFLIPPQSITKANWRLLVTGGFLKQSEICSGEYKKFCSVSAPLEPAQPQAGYCGGVAAAPPPTPPTPPTPPPPAPPPPAPQQTFPAEPQTASGKDPFDGVPQPTGRDADQNKPGGDGYVPLARLPVTPASNPLVPGVPTRAVDLPTNSKGQRFRVYASASSGPRARRALARLKVALEAVPLKRAIPAAIEPVRLDRLLVAAAVRLTERSRTQLAALRDRYHSISLSSLLVRLERRGGPAYLVFSTLRNAEVAARAALDAKVRRHELSRAKAAAAKRKVRRLLLGLLGQRGAPFLYSPRELPSRPSETAKRLRTHRKDVVFTLKPMSGLPKGGYAVWFAIDPDIGPGETHLYVQEDVRDVEVEFYSYAGTEHLRFYRFARFELDNPSASGGGNIKLSHHSDKASKYGVAVTGDTKTAGSKYRVFGVWHREPPKIKKSK